jgi:hypothetical protein
MKVGERLVKYLVGFLERRTDPVTRDNTKTKKIKADMHQWPE